jgi:hypothetical protein
MQPTFQQQTLRELYSIPETTPPPVVDSGMTNKQIMIYTGVTIGAIAIGCIIVTVYINSKHNTMLIELQKMHRENEQKIAKYVEGTMNEQTILKAETTNEQTTA